MPKLVDESVITLYKNGMRDMRDTLGRTFTLHLSDAEIQCPNCMYDPVNKKSAGVYQPLYPYPSGISGPKDFKGRCPICRGQGYVIAGAVEQKVKGIPYWLEGRDRAVVIGGVEDYVDVMVTNIPIRYLGYLQKAQYALIDNRKVELAATPVKEGLRDLIKCTAPFPSL